MKRVLISTLLIAFSLLACGFCIETKESRREAIRAAKAWKKEVKKNFDLAALHDFLNSYLSNHDEIRGIDISETKTGTNWVFRHSAMSAGDWNFYRDPNSDEFQLTYEFDDFKYAQLRCMRISKREFKIIGTEKGEYYELFCLTVLECEMNKFDSHVLPQ